MGWEQPPESEKLRFVQPGKTRLLPHLPKELPFPASGDLRWRPFVAGGRGRHVSLLTLVNADGTKLGDAVAYVELPTGGRVVYVWFALLHGPNAPGILHDVFDFVASRLGRSGEAK